MVEQFATALIVLAAAAFVVRRMWRAIAAARAPKGGACDAGCGCAAPPADPRVKRPG
ncbi:MAG: FeoB-associated Cys-rich membrane protein [Gemmatimonadaceae bacterium]|nr:FeoB-associated Cys-rich membrane protein [Gemmatimonadaceae bacterium]